MLIERDSRRFGDNVNASVPGKDHDAGNLNKLLVPEAQKSSPALL